MEDFTDPQQLHAFNAVVEQRKSVFLTGRAGTGKSFLLRHLIKQFTLRGVNIAVTASTGIAARNLNGTTFHRFIGCGIPLEPPQKLLENMVRRRRRGSHALQRWRAVEVLVVDEVSMLDGELFAKIEELARLIRRNDKPFGGIQLILVGDLYQLGPVQSYKSPPVKWCFECPAWNSCIDETIELEKVYRQTDIELVSALSQIRVGEVTDDVVSFMKALENTTFPDDGIASTLLVSTNAEASSLNTRNTEALGGNPVVFEAKDCGIMKDDIDKHCITPKTIVLKRGSQVMLTQNISEKLVNGSRGIVVGFGVDSVLVKFTCGHTELINKTLWTLEMLKRVADDRILQPTLPSEYTSARILAAELKAYGVTANPHTTTVITASRVQVPLVLAWAITIHKVGHFYIEFFCISKSCSYLHPIYWHIESRPVNRSIDCGSPSNICKWASIYRTFESNDT